MHSIHRYAPEEFCFLCSEAANSTKDMRRNPKALTNKIKINDMQLSLKPWEHHKQINEILESTIGIMFRATRHQMAAYLIRVDVEGHYNYHYLRQNYLLFDE